MGFVFCLPRIEIDQGLFRGMNDDRSAGTIHNDQVIIGNGDGGAVNPLNRRDLKCSSNDASMGGSTAAVSYESLYTFQIDLPRFWPSTVLSASHDRLIG